jgi:hypothetical protein
MGLSHDSRLALKVNKLKNKNNYGGSRMSEWIKFHGSWVAIVIVTAIMAVAFLFLSYFAGR